MNPTTFSTTEQAEHGMALPPLRSHPLGWSRWRVMLRIARRTTMRNKVRSILILALIAFPVGVMATVAVTTYSQPLTPTQQADSALGAADALISGIFGANEQVTQLPDGTLSAVTGPSAPDGSNIDLGQRSEEQTTAALHTLFPAANITAQGGNNSLVNTPTGALSVSFTLLDLSDASIRPELKLVAGSWDDKPGTVVLSTTLAAKLHASVGGSITVRANGKKLTVVGIIVDPFAHTDQWAVVAPGTFSAESSVAQYRIHQPGGVSWDQVLKANKQGFAVISRKVLLNPPPRSLIPALTGQDTSSTDDSSAVTLAVGVALAILQLALLAGPAFAVSAKRRQRDMALLATAGGARSDLRRAMLAEAIVLGVVAAVLGVAGGIAAAVTIRSRYTDTIGPLRLPVPQLALIAALGLLSAVISALIPAYNAARLNVVAALAGRRGDTRRPWRSGVGGFVMAGVGAVVSLLGATHASAVSIMIGIGLCELGLLALTPALLSAAAALAPRLPVSARIALRDASRNRTAAVPALAAVLAACTAAIAVAIYASSRSAEDQAGYQAQVPRGEILVGLSPDPAAGDSGQALAGQLLDGIPQLSQRALISEIGCQNASDSFVYGTIPGSSVSVAVGGAVVSGHSGSTTMTTGSCTSMFQLERPLANQCPALAATQKAIQAGTSYANVPQHIDLSDPRCLAAQYPASGAFNQGTFGQIVTVPADKLALLTGTHDPAKETTLRNGGVLVSSGLDLDGQKVTIGVYDSDTATSATKQIQLDGATVNGFTSGAAAIMTPQTATKLGIPSYPVDILASTSRPLSDAQEQSLNAKISDAGLPFTIEKGFVDPNRLSILMCLAGAVVVAAGATVLATALSVVDSRPDMTTLWAIGAPDRVRRRLNMSRAALVAGIGTALGCALGFIPPLVLLHVRKAQAVRDAVYGNTIPRKVPVSVPWWPNVIGTAVLVPLVAILVAAVMTKRRQEYRTMTAG